MNKDNYTCDEYYLTYCIKGCCKYTEENSPKNLDNGIWEELSEIRKVFLKVECKRMDNPLI